MALGLSQFSKWCEQFICNCMFEYQYSPVFVRFLSRFWFLFLSFKYNCVHRIEKKKYLVQTLLNLLNLLRATLFFKHNSRVYFLLVYYQNLRNWETHRSTGRSYIIMRCSRWTRIKIIYGCKRVWYGMVTHHFFIEDTIFDFGPWR